MWVLIFLEKNKLFYKKILTNIYFYDKIYIQDKEREILNTRKGIKMTTRYVKADLDRYVRNEIREYEQIYHCDITLGDDDEGMFMDVIFIKTPEVVTPFNYHEVKLIKQENIRLTDRKDNKYITLLAIYNFFKDCLKMKYNYAELKEKAINGSEEDVNNLGEWFE